MNLERTGWEMISNCVNVNAKELPDVLYFRVEFLRIIIPGDCPEGVRRKPRIIFGLYQLI